jgi:DNA/RNA-binding protein KIN17
MELLRRRYGTKRVNANQVYQELIKDKDHIHMNATIWITLTAFVKHLGRLGKVVADLTEKGWFVTYVDRLVPLSVHRATNRGRYRYFFS